MERQADLSAVTLTGGQGSSQGSGCGRVELGLFRTELQRDVFRNTGSGQVRSDRRAREDIGSVCSAGEQKIIYTSVPMRIRRQQNVSGCL